MNPTIGTMFAAAFFLTYITVVPSAFSTMMRHTVGWEKGVRFFYVSLFTVLWPVLVVAIYIFGAIMPWLIDLLTGDLFDHPCSP